MWILIVFILLWFFVNVGGSTRWQIWGEYEVADLRAMSGLMAGKKNEVCANVILVSFFHGFQCLNLTFRD